MAIYRNPTCLAILRELDEIVYHGDFKRAYKILSNPDNEDVLDAYLEDNVGDELYRGLDGHWYSRAHGIIVWRSEGRI
jgi:hypothetical protein